MFIKSRHTMTDIIRNNENAKMTIILWKMGKSNQKNLKALLKTVHQHSTL